MIRLRKPSKKIAGIALIASLLLVPSVVSVYAQSNDLTDDTPVVTQTDVTDTPDETTPTDTETTPAEDPVETPPAEEEEIVDTPDTTVDSGGVSLGEAQIIATTEHPGSTIKKSSIKTVDGNAVYAFYFEDGWKVYVKAIDGTVVTVADQDDNHHDCKNKLKDDPAFQAWLEARRAQRRTGHADNTNNDKENKQHSNRRHKHWSNQ